MNTTPRKPVLVVLAAGMGSRYGGLKQLDPVGSHGQLIIDYSIYDARRAGFESVIFIIKHAIEREFHDAIGDRLSKVVDVNYAFQEMDDLPPGFAVPEGRVKPWGTTHAVLCARELIHGPFAVINSDDCYGPEAYRKIFGYLSAHPGKPGERSYAMVGYRLNRTVTEFGSVTRGVCETDAQGYLTAINECHGIEKDGEDGRFSQDGGKTWTRLPGQTTVSMNLWGLDPSFLDEAAARFPAFLEKTLAENPMKGEFLLPESVGELVRERKATVKVLSSADQWYGVTYREDKPGVMAAIARQTAAGLYPDDLWGAV